MTKTAKLPKLGFGMPIDQACLIETYSLLVKADIISEEMAAERYQEVKKRFGIPGKWKND